MEELISEGHDARNYTLREIKLFWEALQKRKLREAKLHASLIRLAVWGTKEDWERIFGEEKGSSEELLEDLKRIGVLEDGGQGEPNLRNTS